MGGHVTRHGRLPRADGAENRASIPGEIVERDWPRAHRKDAKLNHRKVPKARSVISPSIPADPRNEALIDLGGFLASLLHTRQGRHTNLPLVRHFAVGDTDAKRMAISTTLRKDSNF
jgi:hypothetical protein